MRNSKTPQQRAYDAHLLHMQKAGALLDRLTGVFNLAGSLLVLGVMVLVNIDVFGRNLMNYPIPGVTELASMSVVAMVFLQIAHAFRCGQLTRSFALLNFIESRSLRVRAMLELALCCAAATVVSQLLWASWPLFHKAWTRNTYEGAIGSFTIVEWPIKLVIVIGCAALLAQIFIRAIHSLLACWYQQPLARVIHDDT